MRLDRQFVRDIWDTFHTQVIGPESPTSKDEEVAKTIFFAGLGAGLTAGIRLHPGASDQLREMLDECHIILFQDLPPAVIPGGLDA